jgi:hypothetical protein
MAIIHNPDSEYSRELAKWDTPERHGGFGPNAHEEFPKMMYRARERENGKVMCGDPLAATGDALAGYEKTQVGMADITAMRHFSDQRMSETAKVEAKVADDATHLHVPSIPAPRKRGRPKRVVVPN